MNAYRALILSLHPEGERWMALLSECREGDGHVRYIVEVSCPSTAQVRMAEAGDDAIGIEVAGDIVPACTTIVGAKLYHAEGGASSRVDITHPVGTYEGIDPGGEALLSDTSSTLGT